MNKNHFSENRICTAISLGILLSLGNPVAMAEEDLADYSGILDLGVGGAFIDGDNAAFQRRVQQNGDFYGGISDFAYEREVGDILWTLDGHALFGNNDYLAIIRAAKEDVGYLEVGYREFTTFYDGTGGYLPGYAPSFYPLANDSLELDRGSLWFEAGLRQEGKPEVTFRYTHAWREGQKDSTIWGRPDGKAIQYSLNDIDETRDIVELYLTHVIGNTDLALGLRYEMIDNSNDRIIEDGAEVHTDAYEADLFNAHASSVSRISDKMMLSFGYAFTTLNTDTYVSRTGSILGFNNGGANQKTNVINANFWWNPVEDLVLVPSIRAEWNDMNAISNFWYDGHGGDGYARPTVDVEGNTLVEQIEARYQGIDNILLYSRLTFEQEDEDTDWVYFQELDPTFDPLENPSYSQSGYRYKECDASRMKTAIGVNWYARKGLSFAAEYYHKETDLDYQSINSGSGLTHFGDAHIQSLDMSTNDINLRMTWRARPDLTLVTRYDWMVTTYDMIGFDGSLTPLPEIESGETDRSIISQSATYLLSESMYLQGYASYIWSDTDSAGRKGGANYVNRSDNDYLTVGLTTGYALDEKTDITAGYSYYYAKNYSLPSGSVGYGTDLEEHVISLGINRQLRANMILNVGYAYYNSNEGSSGGDNDFDAHMLSSGLQFRF